MEKTVLPPKLEGCGVWQPYLAKTQLSERPRRGGSHGPKIGQSATQEEVTGGNENCCSRMSFHVDEYINRNNQDEIGSSCRPMLHQYAGSLGLKHLMISGAPKPAGWNSNLCPILPQLQYGRQISAIYIYIYIYTGCPRRNVSDFGRVFLMLKYTDITQNTYVQSWTVTEIMVREKCGLLARPQTVIPLSRHFITADSLFSCVWRQINTSQQR
jgi:hypothetical protein